MTHYTFVPIHDDIARHVRATRTDPIYGYEHCVAENVAGPGGYGPCRQCLRPFSPGERRLLFLYNPFGNALGDFAGPVFIHADDCEPFAGGRELPAGLDGMPFFLRSYDRAGHLLEHVENVDSLPAQVGGLFDREDAAVVHLRNREARCFVARAIRAPA